MILNKERLKLPTYVYPYVVILTLFHQVLITGLMALGSQENVARPWNKSSVYDPGSSYMGV